MRIENEHFGPLAAAESFDRGRASVAGCRPDDDGSPIAPRQRMVDQPAQPLHGEVLERQRRPVEQFQQKQIVVDLDQRRLGRMPESAIGVLGHRVELVSRQIVADEGRDEARGGLGVGQARQRPDGLRPDLRDCRGRIETAVAREAGERRVEEAERRRVAARRNILHVRRYPWGNARFV